MSRTVIDILELPKDILFGIPYLTFHGNLELIIENHRGLINYSETEIIVMAKDNSILVTGVDMVIDEYSKDSIIIRGHLDEVRFIK